MECATLFSITLLSRWLLRKSYNLIDVIVRISLNFALQEIDKEVGVHVPLLLPRRSPKKLTDKMKLLSILYFLKASHFIGFSFKKSLLQWLLW